jgi:hypothetical protein
MFTGHLCSNVQKLLISKPSSFNETAVGDIKKSQLFYHLCGILPAHEVGDWASFSRALLTHPHRTLKTERRKYDEPNQSRGYNQAGYKRHHFWRRAPLLG